MALSSLKQYMASSSWLSLTICSLVLFNVVCFAQIEQVTHHRQRGQQERRTSDQCQIDRLNAAEPNRKIESEAGLTEIWDENDKQFVCAGVTAFRHTIQRRGLLLPYYTNAPKLLYVVQGRGIQGQAIPGCAETFHSESRSLSQVRGEKRENPRDEHQRIRNLREGDVVAVPAGISDWIYNDGDSQLVLVAILDVGNNQNQLDNNMRKFFIAGNPQEQLQGQRESQSERFSERSQRRLSRRETHRRRGSRGGQESNGNILSGFDEELLAEAFNIDTDLAKKVQNQNDNRGIIVQVQEDLQVVRPGTSREEDDEERERSRRPLNGLEETFCAARMKHNIADPQRADIYNPRGGRITNVNSYNLPILRFLRLSAEHGVLYRNAIKAPHWNQNAHSIVYIIRGEGRMQVVNNNGESVFNEQVREGQMIVVPQNFAAIKRASGEGLEWIAFRTNDLAKTSPLAGRTSVMRALPVDVLMNSYQISREDAQKLKHNREEVTVFGPGSRSGRKME